MYKNYHMQDCNDTAASKEISATTLSTQVSRSLTPSDMLCTNSLCICSLCDSQIDMLPQPHTRPASHEFAFPNDTHFMASLNVGWLKLRRYYSITDLNQAYIMAVFLHPHH